MHKEETEKLPLCPLLSMTHEGGCRCWGDWCAWWSGNGCCLVERLTDMSVSLESIDAAVTYPTN
ncbi:MAG: hypothetical protein LIO95_03690 [Clostridiales bacterium]|nr:hypothetical protein [Clostridiales bacterium]